MKKRILSLFFAASSALWAFAANTVTTVSQVSSSVTISDDVDYVITGTTPFTASGSVDITNTDHAVLIIKGIRPSKVISSWLKYVSINGEKAVNNTNCQVKMYAYGTIIMPYSKDIKPLTVYSEQNFGGTAVNDFGLEHTNGFMNTLTDEKLNNRIRSFKLKRGYMVTFSTRKEGRGYSRCFIADTEDLEFAVMPDILDNSISSYRVFQWLDAQKKNLADNLDATANTMLGTASSYAWNAGESKLPDIDCVSHHIYENYPSPSDCGKVTYTCHMKTNNEPANTSDDPKGRIETVAEVLANWEDLMRTGLRLCSPSTHDGGWGWHADFMKEIDARGWRCDVVDFHGYWDGEWNNFTSWRIGAYAFNRPVWISEWVWGASWNNNGIFATDRSYSQANQQLNATNVKRIVEMLENEPRVERYYYWNHEADCSKLLKDGKLSLAGEYYATVNSNMAYRKAGEYVPTTPPQYDPENLRTEYDKTQKKVLLYWHETNGEYNKEMRVQRYDKSTSNWKTVQTVPLQEEEADYEFAVDGNVGEQFRILVVDANGKERASNTSQAASDDLVPGDEITVDEGTFYLGGNMLVNGDFELGLADWENGAGEPLVQPYYEALPVGGVNGSAYLQTYGNSTDKTSAQSIRRLLPVEGEYYYAQMASCNGDESKQRISTSISGAFPATKIASASATADWSKQGSVVKILDDYKYILVQLTNLNGKAQFDNFVVARLFAAKDDALADALGWEKKRIEAFKAYNTAYPQLNAELDLLASGSSDPVLLEKAVKNALAAMKTIKAVPALCAEAELAIEVKAQGYAEIQTLLDDLKKATAAEDINTCYAALAEKLPQVMPYELQTIAIQNGTFAAVQGWNTIKGTYTGGDQRMATLAGKTCWNAWWSTPAAGGEATTMAIDQTVSKPDHGYYALEAKATTEHYCVTDQHAFMVVGTDTLNTPAMSRGVLDIPTIADSLKWETLTTPYVYLTETDALTVGFTGSKKNAVDNAFHTYGNPESTGDQREGWWGATDFRFRLIRAYRDSVDASGWGSVCTPYAIAIPEGVTLYKVDGISADKSVIGISQVTETEAGTPYIYYSKNAGGEVVFLESGTKASSAKTVNGLRGWFANAGTSQYPLNALVMQNGKFENVSVRYKVKSFSAFVQKIENLPTLPADWSGEGIATEGVPTAIAAASSDTHSADEPAYNLNGTRANKAVKGIKVKKGRKVVE